ncbi:MAG: DUF302 domain-containing protein [Candidatus Thiodiazotropha sp.]
MNILRTGTLLLPLLILLVSSPALADDGDVIKIDTRQTAAETVESLKKLIAEKRFKIFSVHDHGDAKSVKQVIAFGKTSHNQRIMWHDPAAGLELPLKIAVFQDDVGTQVIYRKPTSLRNTYSLQNCNLLDELDQVVAELAQKAAQ